MDVGQRAQEMLAECVSTGQSARRLEVFDAAEPLRQALRSLARDQGLRIRTAVMDDVVVVARTDAELWLDDAATMRRKLAPPP